MESGHLDAPRFFGILAVILLGAKVFGLLARRIGQPAILGELIAGIVLGRSALGWVDPRLEGLHLLSELGVLILLFAIGLETNLGQLLRVGGTSATVAAVGVALPFALGFVACRLMGVAHLPALVVSASLTATSVGITARVFAELGHLQEPEGRIVLGAAVLDDVLGLVILTVVFGVVNGNTLSAASLARTSGLAFGFLIAAIVLGTLLIPMVWKGIRKLDPAGASVLWALLLALTLAWVASACGSAPILGAFVAGLLLHGSEEAEGIERGITDLGHLFVPIFFVCVGAAVDVRVFDPSQRANWPTLAIGATLIVAAILGKFASGYAPWWFKGRKAVIGVGMIPRGEVGLIFAEMGDRGKIFDSKLFGAVTLMVVVTTFLAPPVLRRLLVTRGPLPSGGDREGIDELVTEI
ncbi:MAG: Kef-type transport system, rane component [Planctomycetota bacterium]|nr:Kef-type transport system, rane component [Planctomycetota bacterium]